MKNKSIVILHFQPLEKYPPITNLLDFLSDKNVTVLVISTKNNIGLPVYINNSITIIRYPAINEKAPALIRLIQYLTFYTGSLITLLVKRTGKVLYYETISSLSAIIYYYLSFKKVKLIVHYHEYNSPEEYRAEMVLSRWLHRFEQKVYPSASWLSHTNHQRMELFLKDNTCINRTLTRIMPNYPPGNWAQRSKPCQTLPFPVKIVYVGSVSIITMYFPEFINWVIAQQGNVLFDIYAFGYSPEFRSFIENRKSHYITMKGLLDYHQFPEVMQEYQIGVILYKGHIPNYVYNAPNKLFEYLACGLDVWVPEEMKGSHPYVTKGTFPVVRMVDFKNLNTVDLKEAISRNNLHHKPSTCFCEPVYAQLTNFLDDEKG